MLGCSLGFQVCMPSLLGFLGDRPWEDRARFGSFGLRSLRVRLHGHLFVLFFLLSGAVFDFGSLCNFQKASASFSFSPSFTAPVVIATVATHCCASVFCPSPALLLQPLQPTTTITSNYPTNSTTDTLILLLDSAIVIAIVTIIIFL